MRNTIKVITSLLLILTFSCEKELEIAEYACYNSDLSFEAASVLAWEDIYADDITSLVNQKITIKSKLHWVVEEGAYDNIPDFNLASPVRLLFERGDNYIDNQRFHNQGRGNLFLISDQIEKEMDLTRKEEKYFLNGKELSNQGNSYLIQGRIRYRDWLNADTKKLANPDFINQSNKVAYWNQTFEFVAESMCAGE